MGRNRTIFPLNDNDYDWVIMFRNNLKEILKSKHLSLKDLSIKLDIPYHKMLQYTDGTTRPNTEVVQAIAEVVGCTIDELTDETYCPWNYGLTEEEIAKKGRRLI